MGVKRSNYRYLQIPSRVYINLTEVGHYGLIEKLDFYTN